MTNTEMAEAFFDALAREDEAALRGLCADDFRPQQNGAPPLTIEMLIGFSKAVHAAARGFRYADPVRSATPGGFVQEHRISGTLASGKEVDVAVCVVADIKDGKITSAREYFDSAAGAELLAALGAG